ncbi:MAG: PAS domain S-box protein [Candidatus Thorarchaeota archaeon]
METKYRRLTYKLEQQLKESEEKFRIITQQSIIGIGILQDNILKYINEGASKINEYSIEEMQNWSITNIAGIIYPEDLSFAMEQARKKQLGKKEVVNNYEYRIIAKSGKVKWIDQYSKTILYEGKPADLSIWIDITEKKKTEEEIRNTQTELATIFNVAGNGIRVIDRDFNVLRMNQAFIELTGADETELKERKCYEQFSHAKCHTPECTLNQIIKGDQCVDIEVIKKRHDGIKVICNLVATPFRNAAGELLGIVEVFKDITKRKISEQKLIESEKKYRKLIEDTLVGVWVINSKYETTFANPQMAKILGYEVKEMMEKTIFNFIDNNSKEIAKQDLKIQKEFSSKIEREFKFLHKSGRFVYTQLRATPIIDEHGVFIGAFAFIIDITKQKRAELELKESEEKFKALFKFNPLPTYVWKKTSDNMILIDYNDAAYKITNGGVKNFLQIKATDLYKDNPVVLKDLYQCMNEKRLISKKMNYIFHTNKKEKILDVSYAFIPPDVVMVHTEDITQKRKTENALIENERFLSNIFSSIQDGLCVIDKNYNILRINPTMEKWYPHMIPIRGKKCYQVYQHRSEPCEDCLCAKIYETNEPILKTILRKGSKGEALGILEIYTFPLFDQETGIVNGVIEYIRDVTESKLAEQKLKESEEKYRSILENIKEGYFEVDLKGNFIFCNDAFYKIVKLSNEELIGKNFSHFIKIEHSENILQRFNDVFKTETPQNMIEIEVKSKDGTSIFVESSAYIKYNSEGKKIGFYGLIRDMTEKKKAEEMVRLEIEKLKELDRIKTDFIDRISHELRTPLVSISSASQLLLESSEGKINSRTKSLIQIINNGGKRLENLIDNLLDVSRIESNKLELMKQKENLVKLILECIDELRFVAEKRNLITTHELPRDLYLKIDYSRIRQVILNILLNAIKNTPHNGLISINLEKQKNFIIIKIKDTGVGFTKKEKSVIFKKFGKIERYGKGLDIDTEGSGLGLYISKEIVKAHNGLIWAESKGRNKGSTFNIKLPIKS